jgi:hypothetical protein
MTAGWMNGFVEIVLGASIVIPIAVGYMGLDWVKENAGFMMAFKTMPYLFGKWGPVLSTLAGLAWFGLLFIAGITSSLAMGTPWMGFVEDEFNWSRKKSAYIFGVVVLILALPTILFFESGVFDEYDYWTGTVALVIFAMAEVILFGWFFGIDNAWAEITRGAEIKVPVIYKFIIKWVTPLFIFVILITAFVKPGHGDMSEWINAFDDLFSKGTWPFAQDSIIGQIFHVGQKVVWFKNGHPTIMLVKDLSRVLLLLTIFWLFYLVRIASKKRKSEGRKIY